MTPEDTELRRQYDRLCHLSMLYSGQLKDFMEGKSDWQVEGTPMPGMIPHGYPGLHMVRDLINLVLLCRAEINCLSKLLTTPKSWQCPEPYVDREGEKHYEVALFSEDDFKRQMTEELAWLTTQKAEGFSSELGVLVTVTDVGIQVNKLDRRN